MKTVTLALFEIRLCDELSVDLMTVGQLALRNFAAAVAASVAVSVAVSVEFEYSVVAAAVALNLSAVFELFY